MSLTLRSTKGNPLTHNELDGNFTYLNSKIDSNTLANAAVLSKFTEADGKVLYDGAEIAGTSSGFNQTAAEVIAELPLA